MAGILQGLDGPSPSQAKSDLSGRASRKKKQRMHAGEPKERKIDMEDASDIQLESDPLKAKYPKRRRRR
jgi:hypothetical protein